jgi:hypothetical protein
MSLDNVINEALQSGDREGLESLDFTQEDEDILKQNVSDVLKPSETPIYGILGNSSFFGFGGAQLVVLTNKRVVFSTTSRHATHIFEFDDIEDCECFLSNFELRGNSKKMSLRVWNEARAKVLSEEINERIEG